MNDALSDDPVETTDADFRQAALEREQQWREAMAGCREAQRQIIELQRRAPTDPEAARKLAELTLFLNANLPVILALKEIAEQQYAAAGLGKPAQRSRAGQRFV